MDGPGPDTDIVHFMAFGRSINEPHRTRLHAPLCLRVLSGGKGSGTWEVPPRGALSGTPQGTIPSLSGPGNLTISSGRYTDYRRSQQGPVNTCQVIGKRLSS